MNKAILIGNLTRDPELKATASGISVCSFSIAVNRNYVNANGEREADFIPIVTWRSLAENCAKYLAKGRKIAVSGNIQTRSYADRNGEKRYVTEVHAEDVEFLTPLGNDGEKGKGASQTASKSRNPKNTEPEDDGLPF